MGGLLNPEDWKQKWKEIDTSRQLVDQAVQDRVGARTFETWVVVEKIETTTTKTLNAVQEMDARMKEMDIKEQAAQVVRYLESEQFVLSDWFIEGAAAPATDCCGCCVRLSEGSKCPECLLARHPT